MIQSVPVTIELCAANSNGEILLVRASDKRKQFTLPYRDVEPGETILEAAKQAVVLFVDCATFDLEAHHVSIRNRFDGWSRLHIVFTVNLTSDASSAPLSDGFRAFKWIPVREIAGDSTIDLRVRRHFGKNAPITEEIFELVGPAHGPHHGLLGLASELPRPTLSVASKHVDREGLQHRRDIVAMVADRDAERYDPIRHTPRLNGRSVESKASPEYQGIPETTPREDIEIVKGVLRGLLPLE